jgi:hypothetical protein
MGGGRWLRREISIERNASPLVASCRAKMVYYHFGVPRHLRSC